MIREEQIANIIGKDEAFEPPFRVNNDCINDLSELVDKNNNIAIIMTRNSEEEAVLADYICDLLNKEHCNGGNQRHQLLSQCCDVVRNTNLSDDIKSHLINTFMRL